MMDNSSPFYGGKDTNTIEEVVDKCVMFEVSQV